MNREFSIREQITCVLITHRDDLSMSVIEIGRNGYERFANRFLKAETYLTGIFDWQAMSDSS